MKRVLLGAPIAHAFHEKIKISLCIFLKKIVHQVIEVDLPIGFGWSPEEKFDS